MSRPVLTAAQERAFLARAREFAEVRRQDAEGLANQIKENEMTHKKTKYGPVPRPPDVAAGDALLDDWQRFIDEALDVADKVRARERALASTPDADTRRFPSLGPRGGQ